MALAQESICWMLMLDILFYEKLYGRLSAEMEYLFDQHLEKCPACRQKILNFQGTLLEPTIARNFG